MEHRKHLTDLRRIVIKIGSSSLTHEKTGHINIQKMEHFVRQVSDLKNSGAEVIIVSSGAQAVGRSSLNLHVKPTVLAEKQAVAAVGQASLMMIYQKLFREYNHHVGQVLLTKDIMDDDKRYQNAKNTMLTLLNMNVIPIVNENDTVSTEEIEFGDNDRLSAMVSILTEADLLILLSDIDGLYDKDPKEYSDAKIIPMIERIDDQVLAMAGLSKSDVGTGGMTTKLMAADMANNKGIDMIIANAATPYIIQKLKDGEVVGTIFKGHKN
ncbi:MAG: glutamate 5-kinase [Vallitaleaceae bacterium]|jgi:glutamate 5-kinase|nr:glutamate 5-kinase [Vallitaleaceae bacterium]